MKNEIKSYTFEVYVTIDDELSIFYITTSGVNANAAMEHLDFCFLQNVNKTIWIERLVN